MRLGGDVADFCVPHTKKNFNDGLFIEGREASITLYWIDSITNDWNEA